MWISEAEARELEQAGQRQELARRATAAARQSTGNADIEILWDGMWLRRAGGMYFPDPALFRVAEPDWTRWLKQEEKYLRDARDYWFYAYQPKPGDVLVDIGAGRGEDTLAFSRAVGPEGKVWAIEPHPISFAALDLFCRLNGLANVTRLNYACTTRPEDLQIETLPVWESNYIRGGAPSPTSHTVTAMPFDTLAERFGIGRINFLKMNIEGAERLALPGCVEALKRTQAVCVAAHDFRAARGEGEHFRTFDEVCQFLAGAGFRLVLREDDPRYYVPYHIHALKNRD